MLNDSADFVQELYWDAPYAIVLALLEVHPHSDPHDIGLEQLAHIVEQLPHFCDDVGGATDQMLLDILTLWYEEKFA